MSVVIAAVVARDQLTKAMRAIHSAFTLSAVFPPPQHPQSSSSPAESHNPRPPSNPTIPALFLASALRMPRDLVRGCRSWLVTWLATQVPISIGVIGLGNVGRQLIEQIRVEHARIKSDLNLDLRVRVIVDVGARMPLQHSITKALRVRAAVEQWADLARDCFRRLRANLSNRLDGH